MHLERFRLDNSKNLLMGGLSRLAQAAQESGEVTILGCVQKPRGCGTWGHGLVLAVAVLG